MTRSSIKPRLLFPSFDSGYGASDDVDEEAETDVEMVDMPAIEHVQETAQTSFTVATPAKIKSSIQPMMSPPTTKRASRKHDADDLAAPADDVTHLPTPARSGRKKKVEINDVPIFHDGTPEPPAAEDVSYDMAPPTPARSTRKKKTETHLTPVIEELESPSFSGGRDTSPAPAFPASRRKARSPFDDWPRTKGGYKRDGEPLEGSSSGVAIKRTRSSAHQEPTT